jgi:hypothetical protein
MEARIDAFRRGCLLAGLLRGSWPALDDISLMYLTE